MTDHLAEARACVALALRDPLPETTISWLTATCKQIIAHLEAQNAPSAHERTNTMTDFTRDWIAKREQLEQAATEGPWVREWCTSDQWWTIHGQPNPAKGDDRMVCPEVATLNHREDWTADVDLIVDARTSLPAAVAALKAVLAFATAERDKISRTYTAQPDTAYAGYANAMDDVIRTIESALRRES